MVKRVFPPNMYQIIDKQRHLSHSNGVRSRVRNPKRHHYHAIQIVLIIGLALSTISLCMRLYIRRRLCKKLMTEDSKYPVSSHLGIANHLSCLEYKITYIYADLPFLFLDYLLSFPH